MPRGARALSRLLSALLRAADLAACAGLVALASVVAGAILARLAYDLTGGAVDVLIPGAIELSTHALFLSVLSALPRALARGLVRVDLVAGALPPRLGAGLDRFWAALAAGIGALAAWRLAEAAARQAESGALTQDLALPLWPLTAYAATAVALFALTGAGLALGARPAGAAP